LAPLQEMVDKAQEQLILLQVKLYAYNISELKQHHQVRWSQILSMLSSNHHNLVAPVFVKMSGFTNKVMNREIWCSNPFFAFEEGYQACLKVYATAYDDESTRVSVYLYLMKGPFDNKLEQSGH